MSTCIVAWAVVFVVASLVALGAYDHLAAGWTRRNRHHGPRDGALGGGSQTWAPDDRDEDGASVVVVALLLPALAVVLATIDLGRWWQWLLVAAVAAVIATYELRTRTPKPKRPRRRRRR